MRYDIDMADDIIKIEYYAYVYALKRTYVVRTYSPSKQNTTALPID